MQSYKPYKQKYVHHCSKHGTSKQLAVCQRMFVVVIFPLPRRSFSLVWRISILDFKMFYKRFPNVHFFPKTSEPYNCIGHTIDSKSLVWISIGKSRFLALINIENWALV